jgi:hypothetical protein
MHSIIPGPACSKNLQLWAFLACFAVLAVACDKLPLLAPNLSVITLSTDSSVVQTNGTAIIRATVLEGSGTPVQNGTTVTFSTNLGVLSPSEARTVNGVASVQFVANGSSGVAEIKANSGAAKPSDAANPALKITVGAAAAGRIAVSANPTTVPSTGGSSTIVASVVDTSGNALRSVNVTFSTTAGTLSSVVATTDQNGSAQTTLTTNREATVTASVGGAGSATAPTSGTVIVRVNAAGTLTVSASPSPATVGQTVSVSVTLAAGGSPVQRVVLDFGDGTSTTLGSTSTTVPHTYTRSGTYVIRATAFDALGDSATNTATLVVSGAPRPTVSISATTTPPPTAGGVTTFTIGVTAAGGGTGAAIEDVTVNFGDGTSASLGGASGTGQQVQHVYSSAGTYTATVEAEDANGASGSASTTIVVQPLQVTTLTASAPTANGTVTFTASVNNPTVPISNYAWTFDDPQNNNQASTTSNSVSHQYLPPSQQRNVRVTVTSTNGQTATGSTVISAP